MHTSIHNRYRCRLQFFLSYPLPLLPVSLVLLRRQPSQAGGNCDKGSSSRPRWANRTNTSKVRSQLIQRGRCGTARMQNTETRSDSTHLWLLCRFCWATSCLYEKKFFLSHSFPFAPYSLLFLSPSLVYFLYVPSTAGQFYARLPLLRYPIVQIPAKAELRPGIKTRRLSRPRFLVLPELTARRQS